MIRSILALDAPLDGRTVPVMMRLAPWSDIAGVAQSPSGAPAAQLELQFDAGVLRSIASVDGKVLFGERAKALLRSPATLAAILEKRFDLYQHVRGAGRVYADCPTCGHATELTLLSLFTTIGQLAPDMISPDYLYFLPPVSGGDSRRPARPDAAYASQLRFELPSSVLNLPHEGPGRGVLDRADPERERAALRQWATDGVNAPIGRAWWAADSAAFLATIRLGASVRDLSPAAEPTPEMFERLPAVDVYFLDALYWYAHLADVPAHAPPRVCPRCDTRFFPVARMP